MKKIQKVIKDKRGMSYPLTVSLVLALLILLCVMAEFFRLNVIAYGVRESLQASVISVATTNYNEVYDGIREGILGTQIQGNYHVKPQSSGYEYRVSDLNVTIVNTPFAPGNANQNFEAQVSVLLEIPLSFGWEMLPPVRMTIHTKAAYMPKF